MYRWTAIYRVTVRVLDSYDIRVVERVKFVWTNSGTWMRPKILDLTLKLNRLAETDEKLDTSIFHVNPRP